MLLSAKQIIQELLHHGYEAYLIGGCVRDKLLGIPCTDEDIVTNATGEQIDELFAKNAQIKHIGKLFGVVQVDGFEVATYRTDIYDDNCKLLEVQHINSLEQDCVRRDFTINSLAMDIYDNIIDHSNGLIDLENKIIRANGEPYMRFNEDPSRILRAVYLAVKLGFTIEDKTLDTIKNNGNLLNKTERNVIGRILAKVFKHKLFHQFVNKLIEYGLLELVFKIKEFNYLNELSKTDSEIISYAVLFKDSKLKDSEIEQILMSYLIPKKDINLIVCLINNSVIDGINDEIIKLNKNRTNLNEFVNMMISYYKIFNSEYDDSEFVTEFQNKIYYAHELPIDGNYLIKLGYTGKHLGNMIETLVKNNCRTLDECKQIITKN